MHDEEVKHAHYRATAIYLAKGHLIGCSLTVEIHFVPCIGSSNLHVKDSVRSTDVFLSTCVWQSCGDLPVG